MNNVKAKAGTTYVIAGIHPQCSWYGERHYFENKTMRCVEVFNRENCAGFQFNNGPDCPDIYDPARAFCFYSPVLTQQPALNRVKVSEEQAV